MNAVLVACMAIHDDLRKAGSTSECIMTIELDRRSAEALCFRLSRDFAYGNGFPSIQLGAIFKYYGISVRVVEKAE